MHYLIASAIAATIVAGLSLGAHHASKWLNGRMQQNFLAAQKAGQIPPDVDLTSGNVTDFGTEVSSADLQLLGLLDAWFTYRVILIPAVILSSLAIAYLWPMKQP